MQRDPTRPWNQPTDDDLVTRLIEAIQRASVQTVTGMEPGEGEAELPAPELVTALLNLLASVLETAPACVTAMGMRQMSEAAGKEVLSLMRGIRELQRSAAGETRQ